MIDPIDDRLDCDEVRDLAGSFVLGALDVEEMDAVRGHLASCAEPHPEFAELGSVVPVLAASVPLVDPPAALKDRLLAAAAADLAARREVGAAASAEPFGSTPAVADPTPIGGAHARESVKVTRRHAGPGLATWVMRVAAVLAIAVLGGWNLLLQGQLDTARSYEQAFAAVLDVAGRDGSLTAVLTAVGDGGPTGLAAVSAGGKVTLALRGLPATSGDQVYEAWVIGGDGTPVAIGSFQVGSAGTAFASVDSPLAEPGIVLALTLEPAPGATTPTLPIVTLGTANAAG